MMGTGESPAMKDSASPDLDYSSLPDTDAEQAIYDWMRRFDDAQRLSYSRVGMLCREVKRRLLWRHRDDPDTGQPCTSFTRWVRVCAPYSYATCFAALGDVESLSDVPDEHLSSIPPSNYPTLRQLSTAVRSEPEVIEAAKTQRNDEFIETIRKSHPNQHLESRKTLRFHPSESAAKKIEEAIQAAMERGASNRDEALECLAVNALEDWRMEQEVESAHEEYRSKAAE